MWFLLPPHDIGNFSELVFVLARFLLGFISYFLILQNHVELFLLFCLSSTAFLSHFFASFATLVARVFLALKFSGLVQLLTRHESRGVVLDSEAVIGVQWGQSGWVLSRFIAVQSKTRS